MPASPTTLPGPAARASPPAQAGHTVLAGPGAHSSHRAPTGPGARRGPRRRAGRGTPSGPPDEPFGPALAKLPAGHAAYLTGHTFFPSLIAAPFARGLDIAFDFAIAACLVAAVASLLRGRRYVHEEHGQAEAAAASAGDDLEGRQGGVLRVGDPAPVGRHLAQRA